MLRYLETMVTFPYFGWAGPIFVIWTIRGSTDDLNQPTYVVRNVEVESNDTGRGAAWQNGFEPRFK
jgi:hypothetical protein